MGYRTWVVVAGVCCCWAGTAVAQPEPSLASRAMVIGHVGVAGAGSGKTVTGEGLEVGVAASVRPFGAIPRLAVEAGVWALRDPRQDVTPSSSAEMSAQQVAVRAAYSFRRSEARLRPYLFGGLAVIHVDYESQCTDCVFDVDPATGRFVSRGTVTERIADTSAGFTLGTGMDIRWSRRVSLRPELSSSSTTPGSGWNWGWAALRVGVAYRF